MPIDDLYQGLADARSEGQRLQSELSRFRQEDGLNQFAKQLSSRNISSADQVRNALLQRRSQISAQTRENKSVQESVSQAEQMKGGKWEDIKARFRQSTTSYDIDQSMALAMAKGEKEADEVLKIRKAVDAINEEAANDDTSGFLGDVSSAVGYMFENLLLVVHCMVLSKE